MAKISSRIPDDLVDYAENLRHGFAINSDLHFYLKNDFGIGIKYARFQASNSKDNYTVDDTSALSTLVSDNIKLNFFGPSVSFRSLNAKSGNAFIVNFFVGYLHYLNDAVFIESLRIRGNTIGAGFDLGYDVKIDAGLYLGLQLSAHLGNLNNFKVSNSRGTTNLDLEELDEAEGLQRIELTVGIRFSK
jgi:hypothetical protein